MDRFKLGQKVTYIRLGKVGRIAKVDAGLGYYVDCDGWTWSVPAEALSSKLPKRYQVSRKRRTPLKSQLEKANDIQNGTPSDPPVFGLTREISEEVRVTPQDSVENPWIEKKKAAL